MTSEVIHPDAHMIAVFTADRVTAEMVRALLEGSGVAAVTRGGASGAYPINVGALGEAQVLVYEEDEGRARDIIGRGDEGSLMLKEESRGSWSPRRIALIVIAAIILLALTIGVVQGVMTA